MAVTSDDVARMAGVSRPAVSQILNGRGRFSADTIRRVEETAAALNYRPSAAARTLATGTSDVVVALVPNTTFGTNLQDFVDLLTAELAKIGLTLVLRFSSSPVELLEDFVSAIRPRAVIALFFAPSVEERKSLEASGVSLIDVQAEITEDLNYRVGRLQGEFLAKKGYTHLVYAHLHDARLDVFGDVRERGLTDYCREAGIAEPDSVRLSIDLQEAVAALEGLPSGVGIACYNDDVAIALLSAARELSRIIPEDVALVGVDATRIGALMEPRITTITVEAASAIHTMIHSVVSRVFGAAPSDPSFDVPAIAVVPGGSA